jgi:hypothetical protein
VLFQVALGGKMIRSIFMVNFLFLSLAFLTEVSSAEEIYVQVRQTVVRAFPQYWSAKVAQLSYGEELKKLSEDEGWFKVKTTAGSQGFVHSSAVTSRRIVFAAKSSGQNFSSSDVVLAGKGFNREVENSYANSRRGADYNSVDVVESLKVSDAAVVDFVTKGKLAR